ncbi:MAG: hypothetical protein WDO12_11810 [Pseudomonadota bacterium]
MWWRSALRMWWAWWGLRHLAYAVAGATYDYGNWPRQLGYEFLKDWKTYVVFLLVIHFYRLLLLRLQGEARLLAAPDAGAPVEAIERPERFLVRKLGAGVPGTRP